MISCINIVGMLMVTGMVMGYKGYYWYMVIIGMLEYNKESEKWMCLKTAYTPNSYGNL